MISNLNYTAYSATDNILLHPPDGHLSSLTKLKAPMRFTDHNNFGFRAWFTQNAIRNKSVGDIYGCAYSVTGA